MICLACPSAAQRGTERLKKWFLKGVAGRGGKVTQGLCIIQGERHGDGPRAATRSELSPATRLPASQLSQALVLHRSTFRCDLRRSRTHRQYCPSFCCIRSAASRVSEHSRAWCQLSKMLGVSNPCLMPPFGQIY